MADAFVKAYISLPDDTPSFRYWLCRVVKNLWLDHLRKHKRLVSDERLQYLISGETPESRYLAEERYRLLWKAMETLTASDREILTLHYFSGLSMQEVAAMVGKSYPALRQRISRLRRTLKERMEEQGYDI